MSGVDYTPFFSIVTVLFHFKIMAKIAFEKYFRHKLREGITETFYKKTLFKLLGIEKLKDIERKNNTFS